MSVSRGPTAGGDSADVQHPLREDDRAAIDRWLENTRQADPGGATPSASATDPRVQRVEELLSLLDTPVPEPHRSVVVDLTVIRCLRSQGGPGDAVSLETLELQPQDEEALDALADAGWRLDRVPRALRARAERVLGLVELLDSPTEVEAPAAGGVRVAEGGGLLADRVMNAVADAEAPPSLQVDRGRWRGRFHLSDMVGIAAVLMMGSLLSLPLFGQIRDRAEQARCMANLQAAGFGFSTYANDYDEHLPRVNAPLEAGWMRVGDPSASNSANLFMLVADDRVALDQLACPGNPHALRGEMPSGMRDWRSLEEISYSYRLPFAHSTERWRNGEQNVVLADRSPVIWRAARGEPVLVEENSPNHDGAGQHLLLSSGGAFWAKTPVLNNGDNIWLPRSVERMIGDARERFTGLRGTEAPADAADTVLVP